MTSLIMRSPEVERRDTSKPLTQHDKENKKQSAFLPSLEKQQNRHLEAADTSTELKSDADVFKHRSSVGPGSFTSINHDVATATTALAMCSTKTVHFKIPLTIVHNHLHRSDITAAEKADAWMTMDDLMKAKREIRYTRDLILHGIFDGDNLELTHHGLEFCLFKLVRACRSVVMTEQYRQIVNHEKNHVLLASRYALLNYKAAVIASARGMKNYEELTKMNSPERLAKEKEQGFGYYGFFNDEDEESESASSSDGSYQDNE